MKKILFISWAGPGHWNPLLAGAEQVLELGHTVEWMCVTGVGGTDAVTKELGGRPFRLHVLENHPSLADAPKTDHLADYIEWSQKVHFHTIEERVQRVREVVLAARPNVIAVSGLVYEGIIAAHLEGIPYACLSTELTPLLPTSIDYEELQVAHQLSQMRSEVFGRFGWVPEFRCNECLSPWQNFVFTTEDFIGAAGTRPAKTQLVGPALPVSPRFGDPVFPWERLAKEKKIIYAAVGSQLALQRKDIGAMAVASAKIGAQLVVATGVPMGDLQMNLPGDTIIVPSAPQRALLERASIFITHGGANSVMEALYHGVPLLVLPVRYDQPLNAHFVVQAGVGLSISRAVVDRDGYAPFLTSLLGDAGIRSRIQRISDSYQKQNGGRAAARGLITLSG